MRNQEVTNLESLLRSLVVRLSQAVQEAELATEIIATEPTSLRRQYPRSGLAAELIDEGSFTVRWNGQVCDLGCTLSFKLIRRLASRPNQYLSHEQLLEDVWGGIRSASTIRSAMSHLRCLLSAAGMEDVAHTIDGSNPGHYGMRFDRLPVPAKSDRDRTPFGR